MRTRHVVLALFVLGLAGVAVAGYLHAHAQLPPALADAYRTVATLASSASAGLAAPGGESDGPDAGDAGTVSPPRVTQTAPLSSAQLSAPLVHGRFVSDCGAPDDMKVVAKVTVKKGRAIAVTVTTQPPSGAVSACVEKAVRDKQWDVSPQTQHATVTY